jgi:hypothetical protein
MTIDEALEDARKKRTTSPVDAALQSTQGDGTVDPTVMAQVPTPGPVEKPDYTKVYNTMQRQGPLMLASEGKQFNSMVDKQFAGEVNNYNEQMKADTSNYGHTAGLAGVSQRSVLANALGMEEIKSKDSLRQAEVANINTKTQAQKQQNELYGSTVAAQQEVLRAQAKFYGGGGQPNAAATPAPVADIQGDSSKQVTLTDAPAVHTTPGSLYQEQEQSIPAALTAGQEGRAPAYQIGRRGLRGLWAGAMSPATAGIDVVNKGANLTNAFFGGNPNYFKTSNTKDLYDWFKK